jgi:hypothetical protein
VLTDKVENISLDLDIEKGRWQHKKCAAIKEVAIFMIQDRSYIIILLTPFLQTN